MRERLEHRLAAAEGAFAAVARGGDAAKTAARHAEAAASSDERDAAATREGEASGSVFFFCKSGVAQTGLRESGNPIGLARLVAGTKMQAFVCTNILAS